MARPDCQYGIECRTAGHDSSHAETYNHICRATEPVQELERDPESWRDSPEYGVRYVTQSSQSNVASLQFSPSSVIWMDGDGPVLLSSSVISANNGRAKIPGKTTLQRSGGATVHYGLNGQGYTHDGTVEVLMDTRNMHWVRTSQGVIPTGCRPVIGGHMVADGTIQVLYHCVVWWRGQRIPGYTSPKMGHAAITWNDSMWYVEDQYELLCWQ